MNQVRFLEAAPRLQPISSAVEQYLDKVLVSGSIPLLATKVLGSVSEWVKVPHLKCGVPKGTVGSNPTTSAKFLFMCVQFYHM